MFIVYLLGGYIKINELFLKINMNDFPHSTHSTIIYYARLCTFQVLFIVFGFAPFADIINAINSNIGTLTDTISQDLTYFSSKFIESGFLTQTATTDIFTKQGISDREKASQLLDRVTTNYSIAPQKHEWVDKFVAVFSSQPAYEGLALMLTGETGPLGIVIQSYCTLYAYTVLFIACCLDNDIIQTTITRIQ